jgi:hypothetical protein
LTENHLNHKIYFDAYQSKFGGDMEILEFVKAVSDPDRLRVIGVLAQKRASCMEVAVQLNLPLQDAAHHLSVLERVELVHAQADVYQMDLDALEVLSREQFSKARESYAPAPEISAASAKVLKAYLKVDGSLGEIPAQPFKRHVILMHILRSFESNRDYSEREVNFILKKFHEDHASLRRYLIDTGLLERESDGSRYWRPLKERTGYDR